MRDINNFLKMISVLFCLLLSQGAISYEYHINSTSEFIQFSKDVSSGTSYNGATVFLDADIDFSVSLSEHFEPIGKSWPYFQGVFDGQGHTISNLFVNSSSQCAGVFGYSGVTIRNVVLDSSCSVVSSYSGSSSVYIGGIIGNCYAYYGLCMIENNVNMASVSFTGSCSLFLGGIVGYLSASGKEASMGNCANYGSVTHSGTADYARIGGIVGCSSGNSPNKAFIQNCLNYGTITHSGTTTDILYIGGILGQTTSGTNNIENCVSDGKITSNKQDKCYIGSVAEFASSTATAITHCYWSSDVGCDKACGSGSPTIDNETKQIKLNTTTVDSLNSYNSSWNKWFMLHLNEGTSTASTRHHLL